MVTENELEHLMNTYGDYIARMCYIYLKNQTLAEDATQEVFIKAYKNMESFRGEASEKTWLTSIAINVCKGYARTNWLRKVQVGLEKVLAGQYEEDNVMQQISKSDLLVRVMALPTKYREVILLFYYQEFKVSEIAKLLEVSESTVKMRLNRARKKMKEELKGEYMYG